MITVQYASRRGRTDYQQYLHGLYGRSRMEGGTFAKSGTGRAAAEQRPIEYTAAQRTHTVMISMIMRTYGREARDVSGYLTGAISIFLSMPLVAVSLFFTLQQEATSAPQPVQECVATVCFALPVPVTERVVSHPLQRWREIV